MRSIFCSLVSVVLTSSVTMAAPSVSQLEQSAKAHITTLLMQPGGFELEYMKYSQSVIYYDISDYHDYDDAAVKSVVLGVYKAKAAFGDVTYGLLFDQAGTVLRLVGLEPVEESCVPYLIYQPDSYTVYYVATEKNDLSAVRTGVMKSLQKALSTKNLQSFGVFVSMPLAPNDSPYEPQDSFVVKNAAYFSANVTSQLLASMKIAGASNVFAGVSRVGNPVTEVFSPDDNSVCKVLTK